MEKIVRTFVIDYDTASLVIKPLSTREETDLELQERIDKQNAIEEERR